MSIGSSGDFNDRNFIWDVAMGRIPGYASAFVVGVQEDLDTVDGELTVWDNKFNVTFLSGSTELFFSSTSAGDTTQVVVVNGLDANFDPIGTIVTLNGQTGVSVGNMTFVYSIVVAAGTVAGDVYIGTESAPTGGIPADANVQAKAILGKNISHNAFYMVPRGKAVMTTAIRGTVDTSNKNCIVRTHIIPFGGNDLQTVSYTVAPGLFEFTFPAPVATATNLAELSVVLPEKAIIEFRAIASSNDTEIFFATDLIVIDASEFDTIPAVVH